MQRQYERATGFLDESLGLVRELQDVRCAPVCLDEVASLAGAQGWATRAVHLFGAAETLRDAGGFTLSPEHADYDRGVAVARAGLAEDAFAAGWAEGRAMSMERAIEYALSTKDAAPAHAPRAEDAAPILRARGPTGADLLTTRERDILTLVARGMTDPQIAEALVIGRRTAETHVAHCLSKLGLANRTQLATWAVEHGLAAASPN
jgi:serine/threonine-protein kinase PknK